MYVAVYFSYFENYEKKYFIGEKGLYLGQNLNVPSFSFSDIASSLIFDILRCK
jgi:hypothetical protein